MRQADVVPPRRDIDPSYIDPLCPQVGLHHQRPEDSGGASWLGFSLGPMRSRDVLVEVML